MAKISPFKALRYDKKIALKDVVCPPYDVINRMQRKKYIRKSPYNIVKIVLPNRKGVSADYKKAAQELTGWIDKGVLKYDDVPGFYVYVQECLMDGKKISRCGFLSLLNLELSQSGGVLPHENVFSKPLFDRVNLMRAIKAHPSPIFIVFNDKNAKARKILQKIMKSSKPDLNIYADNARHKLWLLSNKHLIKELTSHVKASKTFIADGHHRFRASIHVRDYFEKHQKNGKSPCFSNGHQYALAYLVSSKDPGLKILPTHRAVKTLPKGFSMDYIKETLGSYFDITFISGKKSEAELKRLFIKKKCAFVLYYNKKYALITLKDKKLIESIGPFNASARWKGLDVSILHNLVFDKLLKIKERIGKSRNIYYYKDQKELIAQVDSGRQGFGILLNPSTMEDVISLAENNEKMPHKSTYFYPKPLTGLVIHKFD
jgi:uncharacterized protein (DUF1015 family)